MPSLSIQLNPGGVEFDPFVVAEILNLYLLVRRFHLRLMTFMPFGHVWRPPPALNLARIPLLGKRVNRVGALFTRSEPGGSGAGQLRDGPARAIK